MPRKSKAKSLDVPEDGFPEDAYDDDGFLKSDQSDDEDDKPDFDPAANPFAGFENIFDDDPAFARRAVALPPPTDDEDRTEEGNTAEQEAGELEATELSAANSVARVGRGRPRKNTAEAKTGKAAMKEELENNLAAAARVFVKVMRNKKNPDELRMKAAMAVATFGGAKPANAKPEEEKKGGPVRDMKWSIPTMGDLLSQHKEKPADRSPQTTNESTAPNHHDSTAPHAATRIN